MNEFLIKNGLIVSGSANISGSVTALSFIGSITGSATSASFSSTASYINPLAQSVFVSGAFTVTGPSAGGSGIININGTTPGTTNGDAYINFNNSFLFQHNQQGASFYFKQGSTFIWGSRNGNILIGNSSSVPSAKLHVLGSGTTSSTTALLVQDSSTNSSLEVLDNNSAKVGRVSTYTTGNSTLLVGHKTNTQYTTDLVLDPNKDDNTYYKLVLESRYFSGQPFQLYSSGIQTWLYGYASPMFATGHGMKIPTQISMGTTDIGKSEISGSVLFIHGEGYYAQAAYTRYTSYSTGVDTLRGAVSGLWTGNTFRVWNYENTSIDLGVNNVQRLQVTPSGINVTGSIIATSNLTLGTSGKIASGDFANPAGNNSIAMGYGNTAIGNASMTVGFISDTDSGAEYAAAIGYEARSYLPGQISFAYGNHTFNNRDAGAQQSFITVKNASGLTTGATMDLSIAGNSITLLGTNRSWTVVMDWNGVVASIAGTATGVSVGDVAGGTYSAVVKKVGGITSIIGGIFNGKTSDVSLNTVSIEFVVGGSNNLIPRLTGPTFAGGGTVTMRVTGGIKLVENAF